MSQRTVRACPKIIAGLAVAIREAIAAYPSSGLGALESTPNIFELLGATICVQDMYIKSAPLELQRALVNILLTNLGNLEAELCLRRFAPPATSPQADGGGE